MRGGREGWSSGPSERPRRIDILPVLKAGDLNWNLHHNHEIKTINPTQDSNGAMSAPSAVRLCRFCAQDLDLWMEWKSNHCLCDHATSMPCDVCDGANLHNPESHFTVRLNLPGANDRAQP